MNDPVLADAKELLPDAVFLPIDSGTKKPIRSKWQKTSFADSQKPGYQYLLSHAETIGVLLGTPSNGLADLDCDTEPYLEFMLASNQVLQKTLRTHGARAGGIWFRNVDQSLDRIYTLNVQPTSPLAKGGKIDEKTGLVKIGELRCGSGQSILCGLHPDKIFYQWPQPYPPIEIDPRTLTWPEEILSQLPWNKKPKKTSGTPESKEKNAPGSVIGTSDGTAIVSTPGKSDASQDYAGEDKTLLEEAKALLPIYPVLWRRFGFPEPSANPTNSPFRKDERPSFSIFEGGHHAYDHTLQRHYDNFDFFQECTGKNPSHAFKPFITLAGLGSRLRNKPKMGKTPASAPPSAPSTDWTERVLTNLDAYFDPNGGGSYWAKDNREVWIRLDVSDIKRRLKNMGYRSQVAENESISQIDKIILELQNRRTVDYAGPLAGYDQGILEYRGKRILISDSPKFIEPVKGDWPTFKTFLEHLLDAENCDQIIYFNGWMKVALEAERAHEPRPGQAVVFTGEKDCGKSLLQSLITELLGNRMARPYLFMSGQTPFNGNLFGAEHLAIEDEQPYTDIKSRRNFGSKIKEFTAIDHQNSHKKFRDGVTLPVFWRLTISVNDETENLLILPPFDDSISDKLIIFKTYRHPMPMPTATIEDRVKFRTILSAELPAYVHYLLDEWKIDQSMISQRYGIIHYQNPDVLLRLGELAPETRLLQLIDAEIFDLVPPRLDPWQGTSLQLEQRLTTYSSTVRRQAHDLLNWQGACGTYLGRLKKYFPTRFSYHKTNQTRVWTITSATSVP